MLLVDKIIYNNCADESSWKVKEGKKNLSFWLSSLRYKPSVIIDWNCFHSLERLRFLFAVYYPSFALLGDRYSSYCRKQAKNEILKTSLLQKKSELLRFINKLCFSCFDST
jgi:hypothetical protein